MGLGGHPPSALGHHGSKFQEGQEAAMSIHGVPQMPSNPDRCPGYFPVHRRKNRAGTEARRLLEKHQPRRHEGQNLRAQRQWPCGDNPLPPVFAPDRQVRTVALPSTEPTIDGLHQYSVRLASVRPYFPPPAWGPLQPPPSSPRDDGSEPEHWEAPRKQSGQEERNGRLTPPTTAKWQKPPRLRHGARSATRWWLRKTETKIRPTTRPRSRRTPPSSQRCPNWGVSGWCQTDPEDWFGLRAGSRTFTALGKLY